VGILFALGSSVSFIKLKPPVVSVTPAGFKSSSSTTSFHGLTLDASAIKERFFSPGPVNIFNILANVDERLAGVESRASFGVHSCLSQDPVSYTLDLWGDSVQMHAQCYTEWSFPNSNTIKPFMQWAIKDSTTYLYERGGETNVAAIVKSITGGTEVTVYYSVGVSNICGSHAIVKIYANTATGAMELVAAGKGIGYCGAQFKTDGVKINVTGSSDFPMAVDSTCLDAVTLGATTDCGANSEFSLAAIGTAPSYWAGLADYCTSIGSTGSVSDTVSGCAYGAQVFTMNGTGSANNDYTNFGPASPLAGVGKF
jgi:hypothetical protein